MSVAQFQRTVNTFDKEISDMEKKKAAKDKNIAALEIKINSTQKSITKNTAFSIHDSKLRQISHWERERTNKLKESAELSAKIADKKKKRSEAYSKLQKAANEEYDVFVSHAWEDKKDFVDELVFEMRKCGIKVWYDIDRLNCGDSMREKIDKGLSKSKYGVIVVLSPNYISENKYWTKAELNGLFQVETINGKTIIPIWHRLTKKQVTEYSPIIAARRALTTADFTAEEIAKKLKELFSDTRNLKMHTPNKADENYKKLAKLFPNAVTETIDEVTGEVVRAIDKDVLMQEINTKVVDGKEERYQFTWPDKNKSVLLANAPINKTLRPCREESVDFDNTENLYIEGDNLEVLKLLQETYLGKIKMIYIDPPYNTGNDFVYDDDFAQCTDEYRSNSGQFDDEGNRLVKNLESNGRFHKDWLNMMYPRLRLAKDLISDDGVIFISIDDNEQENLKKICDEIFEEKNFLAQLIWERAFAPVNLKKHFSENHDYIICYAKKYFFSL